MLLISFSKKGAEIYAAVTEYVYRLDAVIYESNRLIGVTLREDFRIWSVKILPPKLSYCRLTSKENTDRRKVNRTS